MSVKLSELLEAGAAALAEEVGYFIENGHDDLAANVASKSKALRAIAPALVEFSKVAWEPHACIPSEECCAVCEFRAAMKEAGVTCE